jgi:aspartate aminotransferase-like enzyme
MIRPPKKMFIPGPTEVHPDVFAAMTHYQIGHRTQEMRDLVKRVKPGLKKLFGTKGDVFLSTSSATCVMEGALQNLVKKKLLALECGAWSQKWADTAKPNGIALDRQIVPWGKAHDVDEVRRALKTGAYDTVTMVWCETSTGILNPLADVAKVVREFDDVMFCVDAVSALAAVQIDVDALGIDVCLAGTQKAMAMPPGLGVFTCSERALKRAASKELRGYYMDFMQFKKNGDNDETPSTPTTPHIFALEAALARIHGETMEKRAARHRAMAELTQNWAREHLGLFPDPNYLSPSVSCISAAGKIDVHQFARKLDERGFILGDGYGKLKDTTFRVGHFGEHSVEDVTLLLKAMTEAL